MCKKIAKYAIIAEYTGNRLYGRNIERLHWALEHHRMEPTVLVKVPTEGDVVDPRTVGNEGRYDNHSCSPNARLVEIDVHGKKLIFLAVLRAIEPDEEIYIDYQWYTGRPGSIYVVKCFGGSENCRQSI